ncbi:MAG: methylmalonyl-CoA mutase, partial [Chloroflexia bacterium]|nr:methylmalonyl-CoA mutase [Chloroflexia bacterium]
MFDAQELERIRQAREEWEQEVLRPHLERAPERRERFITTSSAEVERLYGPEDVAGQDFLRDINLPGVYPFTRGVHPTMHRGRLWTMRMFSG